MCYWARLVLIVVRAREEMTLASRWTYKRCVNTHIKSDKVPLGPSSCSLTRSARTEREPQTHDAHEAIIKKGSGIRYTARRIKKGQHCLGCRSAWAKASRVQRHGRARGRGLANGIMVSIYSALVWSHQSTSAGNFGLVRPSWINTRAQPCL